MSSDRHLLTHTVSNLDFLSDDNKLDELEVKLEKAINTLFIKEEELSDRLFNLSKNKKKTKAAESAVKEDLQIIIINLKKLRQKQYDIFQYKNNFQDNNYNIALSELHKEQVEAILLNLSKNSNSNSNSNNKLGGWSQPPIRDYINNNDDLDSEASYFTQR